MENLYSKTGALRTVFINTEGGSWVENLPEEFITFAKKLYQEITININLGTHAIWKINKSEYLVCN